MEVGISDGVSKALRGAHAEEWGQAYFDVKALQHSRPPPGEGPQDPFIDVIGGKANAYGTKYHPSFLGDSYGLLRTASQPGGSGLRRKSRLGNSGYFLTDPRMT